MVQKFLLALSLSFLAACGGGGGGEPPTNTGPADTIDTTPPVITLKGDNPVTLNRGDTYTDAGATATDDIDGDISIDILRTGSVDITKVDSYTLRYNVNDAAGNAALEVTRSVSVADVIPPIVDIAGDIEVPATDSTGTLASHPLISSFLNSASAIDDVDGPLASVINDAPPKFPLTPPTTTVTFFATDNADNTGEAQGVVTIRDLTAPVILLKGASSIVIDKDATLPDLSVAATATATDNVDNDITDSIVVGGDTVNSTIIGLYTRTYNVSDAAGNAAGQVTLSISVQEAGSPVVTPPGDITVDVIDSSGVPRDDPRIANFLGEATTTAGLLSNDAPDPFPLGSTLVTFTAVDGGKTGQAAATVTLAITAERQAFNAALAEYNSADPNYPLSTAKFESFLLEFPNSDLFDQAQLYVGKTYYWRALYDRAKTELDKVITKTTPAPPDRELVAEAYYWKGKSDAKLLDFVAARSSYQKVLDSYTGTVYEDNARYGLASTYYDEMNYDQAITEYTTILADPPNTKSDNSQYFLAKSIYAKGPPFDNARAEFTRLIDFYPASIWVDNAHIQIGLTWLDEQNYLNARAKFEFVINDNSADADIAQFRLGQSYFDEAEATLDSALYTRATEELLKVFDNVKYPNSGSTDIAQYYIARSYHGIADITGFPADYNLARTEYAKVNNINYPNSIFIDNAAYRLASIDYDLAVATGTNPTLFTTAINTFQNAIDNTQGSDDIAQYYIARSKHHIADIALADPTTVVTNQYDLARAAYAEVNNTNYPNSAYIDNAAYQAAKSFYDQADYANAITALTNFTTNFTTSTWVDDGYYYLGHSHRRFAFRQAVPNYAPALAQYNLVLAYTLSDKLHDNAQYYIGYTYHLQQNCTQELIEMRAVVDNYPDSIYATRAQTHITDINAIPSGHTCL